MHGTQVAPAAETFPTEQNPRLRLIIPAVVGIAFLMEQLDSTIIATAIPEMAGGLGTTALRLNLAITAYVLTLAVFIPVSGWFADRFGGRRIFALSLLIFTIGSALCGLSQNFEMLLAMRVLQGLGGAMMTPVGRLVLLRSFPRSQLVTAMTYMTLPAIIGPVIGPLLGGVLTTYLSWRWIFYVNIPFGVLGIVMALRYFGDIRGDRAVAFDFRGFLIVGLGAALLQFGIENIARPMIPEPLIAAVLVAAVLLLLAFGWHARRIADPAVDLTLFRLRSFSVGTLAGGTVPDRHQCRPVPAAADASARFRHEPDRVGFADLRQRRKLAPGPARRRPPAAPVRLRPCAVLERGCGLGPDRRLRC